MTDNILLSDREVIKQDPLLRLLCVRLQWSTGQIILATSFFAAFILLVFGGIARKVHQPLPGTPFIGNDLILFAMWAVLFSPLMWMFYLWQAHSIPRLFAQLSEKGVFGTPGSESWSTASRRIAEVVRRCVHPLIFLLAFLVIVAWWSLRLYLLDVRGQYWFEVKWYLPLYLIAWSLAVYVLCVAAIRHIVFIADLSVLFRNTDIHVNPLDTDGVGGLGAVGALISRTLVFLIGLGLLVGIFIVTTYYRGGNIFAQPDILIDFTVYVVLAPYVLIVPTVSVRNAMLRARAILLAPIAEEFRRSLEQTIEVGQIDEKELSAQNGRLKELQTRHKLIMDTYPVLPISETLLRIFSLTASLPYLSTIVPIGIDWLASARGFQP
jgi:hypothetical protein